MTKEWYKKKGFRKNPLHLDPLFKDPFYGFDVLLDELSYRIEAGNMIFIEGEIGKTALLMKIIDKYKGKGKVIYVNCEKVKHEPNIKILLANGNKSIIKKMKGMPKRMILLLDNITHLSESNAEKIKYYFDQDNIQSVVMASKDYSKVDIPDSIRHRIGKRVHKLRDLTKYEMTEIVLDRLNFGDFLNENHISALAKRSNNIKELLTECDSLLFLMSNEDLDKVDDNLLNKIITKKKNDMVS